MDGNQSGQQQGEATSRTAIAVHQLVTSQVDTRKDTVAGVVETTGTAVRQASETFRTQGQQELSQYIDLGAEKIEEFSSYLRNADAQELIAKAQETARKRPLLVAGAGFALAFLAARLMRDSVSAAPARPAEETQPPDATRSEIVPLPVEAAPTEIEFVEEKPKPRQRRARVAVEQSA